MRCASPHSQACLLSGHASQPRSHLTAAFPQRSMSPVCASFGHGAALLAPVLTDYNLQELGYWLPLHGTDVTITRSLTLRTRQHSWCPSS